MIARQIRVLVAGALLIGALLIGAGPSMPYPTGRFTIEGELFPAISVLDARAMPDMAGTAGLLITLDSKTAPKLANISGAHIGQPIVIALDGKPFAQLMIRQPIIDGVIDIPGQFPIEQAEQLARRISGKDPLPDDLAE